MISIIIVYILAASITATTILVPFVSRLSIKVGGVDEPGERKVHVKVTPRLGGIAIFCSLLFTIMYFFKFNQEIKGFLAGAIIIFLTGLADDLAHLSPRQKLSGEFLAAGLAVFIGGICVRHLGNPFGLGLIELGPLAIPFTIFGIVGLINAINLLDGLDGLAGGVCTIASISFAIISFTSGNTNLFPLTIALIGALLGFMHYNYYPASIFMGDNGSLLLGYCMGTFSVLAATGGNQPVSPYIPLIILGVPIMDTLVVMVNRRLAGKRLFSADNTHLHHRLLDLGIGHKFTVEIVFGISYLLCIMAIFCRELSDSTLLFILLATAIAVYGSVRYLTSSVRYSFIDFSSNQPLRSTTESRLLVHRSKYLIICIKYLIMAIVLLPVFLSRQDIITFSVIPLLVSIVSTGVYLSRPLWHNTPFQCYVYASSFMMIFILENYGREEMLLGVPLLHISNLLFLLLLFCVGAMVILRRRASQLIVSPFEYSIMLIILTTPLLPDTITSPLHLMIVAAKSVILSVGFKLSLTRQIRHNRKIILAISLSSLIIALRYLFAM